MYVWNVHHVEPRNDSYKAQCIQIKAYGYTQGGDEKSRHAWSHNASKLNIMEFMEMAEVKSFLSTISAYKDWRAGMSKVLVSPEV